MSEYIPMVGPHPGTRYMPSNGTEGDAFICEWCGTCARDKPMREGVDFDDCDPSETCEILAASFRDEAVEWRELEDGRRLCLAHVPAGTPLPAPRDERQGELFAELAAAPPGQAPRPRRELDPLDFTVSGAIGMP